MTPPKTILTTLLARGDRVSILNGRLTLEPKSGMTVPSSWLTNNEQTLVIECLNAVKTKGYRYVKYTTGYYGSHKSGGVTLQFVDITTGASAFLCFNANLKHQRNTKHGKKGSPLPTGQFSVSRRGSFYSFWQTSGLPLPESPTRFHQRMGKLKTLLFGGDILNDEQLNKDTIAPLSISHGQLISSHNFHIRNTYRSHKDHIRVAHKDLAQPHTQQGLQPNSSTGENKCGNKVIRECGYKGNVIPTPNTVIDQSIDEWVSDYNA